VNGAMVGCKLPVPDGGAALVDAQAVVALEIPVGLAMPPVGYTYPADSVRTVVFVG
jgi:hypothetical protein